MISLKLVRLIEEHSDELTDDLVRKLQSSAQTRSLQRISAADLRRGIHESLCSFMRGWSPEATTTWRNDTASSACTLPAKA